MVYQINERRTNGKWKIVQYSSRPETAIFETSYWLKRKFPKTYVIKKEKGQIEGKLADDVVYFFSDIHQTIYA